MGRCRDCEWYHQSVCYGDYRVGGILWCSLFVEHEGEDEYE